MLKEATDPRLIEYNLNEHSRFINLNILVEIENLIHRLDFESEGRGGAPHDRFTESRVRGVHPQPYCDGECISAQVKIRNCDSAVALES